MSGTPTFARVRLLAGLLVSCTPAACGLPTVAPAPNAVGPADGGTVEAGDDASGGVADAKAPPAGDAGDAGNSGGGGDAAPGDSGSGSAPGHKRGIAYGYNSDADLAALSTSISWWYNWSPSPDSTLSSGSYEQDGVEFVPMIWGGTFDTTKLASQVPTTAKYLLTFNEPNFGSQSNLTPQQAAALWPKVQSFAQSRGLSIVSPAVNYCGGNCNETDPYVWLSDFFAACQGCQVDYVAVHWYACTLGALTGYVKKFETQFNKPIWLTEFSCLDGSLPATATNEQNYMQQAVAALEADPMVFRYSWFTGRDNGSPGINLLGAASGNLTPLGQEYVDAPPAK
jgi:hypothetical protein